MISNETIFLWFCILNSSIYNAADKIESAVIWIAVGVIGFLVLSFSNRRK